MSRLRVVLLMAFLVSVLLSAAPVLAQGPEDVALSDPASILTILASLAKSVGIGVVLSFLFKNPGWFKDLGDQAKWWIIFGLSLGLPVLAQLLIDLVPPNIWDILNPYWTAIAWGFITWGASQAAFESYIKPIRGDGA